MDVANATINGTDSAMMEPPFGAPVMRAIASIYGLFIIVFGTIGNMLSLKIFWNSDVFKESTHFLLIILQIADSCVLLLVVSRYWIQQAFRFDIRDLGYPVCLTHVVLTYLCVDFATWVLVFIVLDRFLAVTYPIRARLIMTKSNAVKFLAAILVTLCVKDLPLLLSHEWHANENRRCMYREQFFKYYLVADSVLNFFAPDSLLLIFNLTIFFSIRRHTRLMSQSRAASQSGGDRSASLASTATNSTGRKRSQQDSRHRQMSVARVALVSGTIHLLTTMPSAAYLLSHSFISYSGTSFLVNNILLMLSYTNNAINFLIYLPIDNRFRTSFNTMVTPECSNANNLNAKRLSKRVTARNQEPPTPTPIAENRAGASPDKLHEAALLSETDDACQSIPLKRSDD